LVSNIYLVINNRGMVAQMLPSKEVETALDFQSDNITQGEGEKSMSPSLNSFLFFAALIR
jgi:hypothetical protein